MVKVCSCLLVLPAQFAEQVDRRMLLDRFQLAEAASAGDPEANIAPIMINNDPDITFRSPFEYIYARYDRNENLQVKAVPCVSYDANVADSPAYRCRM